MSGSPARAGLAVMAAVFLTLACGGPAEGPADKGAEGASVPQGAASSEPEAASPAADGDEPAAPGRTRVSLYFADSEGALRAELRDLPTEELAHDQARLVVEALLEGPRSGLSPVLPRDATLRALYLGPGGTAFVDLDAAFARGVSGGSEDALLAVYAITDTLAVNFPDVRRVKILVEGEEVEELGGHLDLTRPLLPDMTLIAGGS